MHPYPKHRYIPKEYRHSSVPFTFLFGAIILCFVIFLYWFITVFSPVFVVEVTYQTKKVATALGISSVRSLLLPKLTIRTGPETNTPYGAVVIPALFMDEPVIYNVDPNDEAQYTIALRKGIAHASATKLPDSGGLGYYFAHSSNPAFARQYNAVFYLLGKLKGNEPIYLWHNGKKYEYTVKQTQITKPNDVSFLTKIYDTETIVLQTCWPPGTSLERLLVFAERKD